MAKRTNIDISDKVHMELSIIKAKDKKIRTLSDAVAYLLKNQKQD